MMMRALEPQPEAPSSRAASMTSSGEGAEAGGQHQQVVAELHPHRRDAAPTAARVDGSVSQHLVMPSCPACR